ncbi:MAG: pyridoxamine 5'-phosphate oxidase [Nitrospirae bacterium]|nr:pyridoxamine 5'-phosphate oxidase [Nitrospirota bacterium]
MTRAPNPLAEVSRLLSRAHTEESHDATAATLATVDAGGHPAARIVLIKVIDPSGVTFYTNLESRKAVELEANPNAALCIYWPTLHKQVRIEGEVEAVTEAEADEYFASRPRGSQIGAWASQQSEPLVSRRKLVSRYLKAQARFAGQSVPRPPFWGGYRLIADRIEIWHNQLYRLHDRFLYERQVEGEWTERRLYP